MDKKEIVFINIGSPKSTNLFDVAVYLSKFLMDKNVISLSLVKRFLLVHFIIIPFKAFGSSKKYKQIWTQEGSPLINNTNELANKIASLNNWNCKVAFMYSDQDLNNIFLKIKNQNIKELIIVPLFPHFAKSTFKSILQEIKHTYKKIDLKIDLKILSPFYDNQNYIKSIVEKFNKYNLAKYDVVLFSFHGIPVSHLKHSEGTQSCNSLDFNCCNSQQTSHKECYRHQVYKTVDLIKEKLEIDKSKLIVSFQSRLGRDKWLEPSSQVLFQSLPLQGKRKILVVCPSFVSDCLETLEEICIEGKKTFFDNGGQVFDYVECLNSDDYWVNSLSKIIKEQTNI